MRMKASRWPARRVVAASGASEGTAASGFLPAALADEFDDLLRGGTGEKNRRDAGLFEGRDIGLGDDAADQHGDLVHPFFSQQVHELRADGIVRAGENR